MREARWLWLAMTLLLVAGCARPLPTPVPQVPYVTPTSPPVQPTTVPTLAPTHTALQTVVATKTPAPTVILAPTAVPTVAPDYALPPNYEVQPTATAAKGEMRVDMDTLPIGQPGHYVNVAFGYTFSYPTEWYTRFGNRPLLVSLSNLDPGIYNRDAMRDQGCLMEIDATVNLPGFSLNDIMAQLPRALGNAAPFELGGELAVRILLERPGAYTSDWIYVQHDGRLFLVSAEYSATVIPSCREAWEQILASWTWFEPEFAVFANHQEGYAIEAPRDWYRVEDNGPGFWLSQTDPRTAASEHDLALRGMMVMTTVHENAENLILNEWTAGQGWAIEDATDVPLEDIIGVRIIRQSSSPDISRMSAYMLGPMGRIFEVTCFYPTADEWQYRPVANAIIWSFSF